MKSIGDADILHHCYYHQYLYKIHSLPFMGRKKQKVKAVKVGKGKITQMKWATLHLNITLSYYCPRHLKYLKASICYECYPFNFSFSLKIILFLRKFWSSNQSLNRNDFTESGMIDSKPWHTPFVLQGAGGFWLPCRIPCSFHSSAREDGWVVPDHWSVWGRSQGSGMRETAGGQCDLCPLAIGTVLHVPVHLYCSRWGWSSENNQSFNRGMHTVIDEKSFQPLIIKWNVRKE